MSSTELKSSKFVPLFVTQFLGAFNDNFFKNALVTMLTFSVITKEGLTADTLVQISSAIFILPFVLLSAISGQLADKLEKSKLIVRLKLLEVVLMGLGAIALIQHSLILSWVVLFGLGAQATLFGPLKYSILPQHISDQNLIGANSLIEAGTFIAILIGTILGGIYYTSWIVPAGLMVFAILGWVSAQKIPQAAPGNPSLKVDLNIWRSTIQLFRESKKSVAVIRSVLAISWFWFLGASLLALFSVITKDFLNADASTYTSLLAIFSIGIAAGSLSCEKLAQGKIEIGLVPVGALGMTVFGFLFAHQVSQHSMLPVTTEHLHAIEFASSAYGLKLLSYLFGISFFGGLFIVPLYALLQNRSAPEARSQVIASNNVLNAVFMVASAVYAIALNQLGVSKEAYVYSLFVLNAIVSLYIFITVPEFFFRFIAWLLTSTFYKIKKNGVENIPDEGAALIICNHVSFLDGLIIFGACHRPVKFVMWYKIYNLPVLKYLFKAVGAVPIASKSEDPEVMKKAFAEIEKTLKEGEIIVIFPEGAITHDGSMQVFKPGMLKILDIVNVPVIPCALKGLWGSMFSRKEKSIFRYIPKSFLTRKVSLEVGTALHYSKQENFLTTCQENVSTLLSNKESK